MQAQEYANGIWGIDCANGISSFGSIDPCAGVGKQCYFVGIPSNIDDCGVCSGGSTNITPNADKDCNGDCFGSAIIDD